jgi:hypothetical protein
LIHAEVAICAKSAAASGPATARTQSAVEASGHVLVRLAQSLTLPELLNNRQPIEKEAQCRRCASSAKVDRASDVVGKVDRGSEAVLFES